MNILELRLQTTNLKKQKDFYGQILGLPVLLTNEGLTVGVGQGKLVFCEDRNFTGAYHFAFNIPENQIEVATAWLLQRIALAEAKNGTSLFEANDWDAHAVYFYDAAGNILELIARHELDNTSDAEFSSASLLCVSEIGLAAPDVAVLRDRVNKEFGFVTYHADPNEPNPTFCPVGDANGLFILVAQNREWYPDTGIKAQVLPVEIVIAGEREEMFEHPELPYRFVMTVHQS